MGGMGMGGMGMMQGGMGGMGGMNMGMDGQSGNERAFHAALQASGISRAQLTLLLPSNILQNVLIPRGIVQEIAQRSGSTINLGPEGPTSMRQVQLTGTMVANSMAALYLQ